jgi:glycosyltransferase involved in cell wall biosynthesis
MIVVARCARMQLQPMHGEKMTARTPSVSVCLPVYNGETYVGEAIGSICEQTFEDIEVIISDNASTDGTQALCREAATHDSRVRYFRGDTNRGLAWNWNRAFELATGRYVVWIGHDDLMAPDYIRQCVEGIQQDTDTLLCFTNANYIDGEGSVMQRVDPPNPGAAETPSERFHCILYDGNCNPIFGLMNTQFLKQTRLHAGYADSDRVLLAEMGFRGRFCKIPDYLFSRRMHSFQTTAIMDRWERTLIFDPSKAGKVVCPLWREFFDFVVAIHQAPLCHKERFRAYKYLYWWSLIHRPFLYQDLRRGLKCTTQRMIRRSAED